MTSHTLVLTPWMSPHRVIPWETAVCLYYMGKVEILESYNEVVRSPSIELQVPAVVRLKKGIVNHKKGVKFSRVNVMTRDGFRCQYCGTQKPMKDLNYDHVIPRRQGGKTVWENIVTSCYPCNDKKAGRTPQQAGMKLLKQPTRPKVLPLTAPSIPRGNIPEIWAFYLNTQGVAAFG